MKKHIALLASITLLTAVSQAQQPGEAAPTQTPGYQPVPVDASTNASGTETQVTSTITISRTITNLPNTITIIGTVDNEQQKQNAQTRLQEVFQGRTINNLLIVSNANQSISEPSGAERPSDSDSKKSEESDSSSSSQSQQ